VDNKKTDNSTVYEVAIKFDFPNDYCGCSMIKFTNQKNTPIECLNPGSKERHFVKLINGNIIVNVSKHRSCPFCEISSTLPIHITKCYVFPGYALITLLCTKDVLNRLYDKLDKMRLEYHILSVKDKKYNARKGKISTVTQNQRIALITALHLGYFDTPQKTHIREIAKMLGKSPATVHELLKRGIRNLLNSSEPV